MAPASSCLALPVLDVVGGGGEDRYRSAAIVGMVVTAARYMIMTDYVVSCGCGPCKLHRLRR
jgi:hypothetical protein